MIKNLKKRVVLVYFLFRDYIVHFNSVKKLDYPKSDIYISIDNFREYETRANSVQKEPDTVNWIDKFIDKDSIFYDIGSNIGAYSLIAASRGSSVISIEPAFQNYYKLQKNISLNNMDNLIQAFPVALSSKTKIDKFVYQDTTFGTSKCFYNEKFIFRLRNQHDTIFKSSVVFQLDDFIKVFKLPFPTAMKIDVDGGEFDIIAGAKKTLTSKLLKTIVIEVDIFLFSEKKLDKILEKFDFKCIGVAKLDKRTLNKFYVKGSC